MMRRDGCNISSIVGKIGRSKSTVSCEFSRNSCERFCRVSTAQRCYEQRKAIYRRHRILDDPSIFEIVREKFLGERWPPEQLQGGLALELGSNLVSDAAIYRAIRSGRFDGCLDGRKATLHLCHKGKRRRAPQTERRGKIIASHEISERPEVANGRSEAGH